MDKNEAWLEENLREDKDRISSKRESRFWTWFFGFTFGILIMLLLSFPLNGQRVKEHDIKINVSCEYPHSTGQIVLPSTGVK